MTTQLNQYQLWKVGGYYFFILNDENYLSDELENANFNLIIVDVSDTDYRTAFSLGAVTYKDFPEDATFIRQFTDCYDVLKFCEHVLNTNDLHFNRILSFNYNDHLEKCIVIYLHDESDSFFLSKKGIDEKSQEGIISNDIKSPYYVVDLKLHKSLLDVKDIIPNK